MEFNNKIIPGTEEAPGVVYVGDLGVVDPIIIDDGAGSELLDNTEQNLYDREEVIRYMVHEADYSEYEIAAFFTLMESPELYIDNSVRLHLAEITETPFVALSQDEDTEELKARGIKIDGNEDSFSNYMKGLFHEATANIKAKVQLGTIALYNVDPELWREEWKVDPGVEGGDYSLYIDEINSIILQRVAKVYKEQLAICQWDGYYYGLDTARDLANSKSFNADADVADKLLSHGCIDLSDIDGLVKYGLISRADAGVTTTEEDHDSGSGYMQSEENGRMHTICFEVGYPCEACGPVYL